MSIEPLAHLLKPGESLVKFDTSGWIVVSKQLKPGMDIVIAWPDWLHPALFEEPVRFTVNHVFSNGVIQVLAHDGIKGWTYDPDWPTINLPDKVMWGMFIVSGGLESPPQ